MAKKRSNAAFAIGAAVVAAVAAVLWIRSGIAPTPPGPKVYVRYERPTRLGRVLGDLARQGVIANPTAMQAYAWFTRHPQVVPAGTFKLSPGMSADAILGDLTTPVRQLLRIPETDWSQRVAAFLAERDVVDAGEYIKLVHSPELFRKDVSFPLTGPTLEGYLYPDTYDLPPLLGARAVILRQLKAFERKVWKPLQPANLLHVLTVASMIQMETGRDGDDPMIAEVIENRLQKHMPLQIDATILYVLQRTRRLTFADYHSVDSPYNTYLHEGLPPGPICSPTERCVQAALHPTHFGYLYYVALPSGKSMFSKDYSEHLHNIARRNKALGARAAR